MTEKEERRKLCTICKKRTYHVNSRAYCCLECGEYGEIEKLGWWQKIRKFLNKNGSQDES